VPVEVGPLLPFGFDVVDTNSVGDEIWEHRRGLLQIGAAVTGGACIFVTGGLGAPVCVGIGGSIAAASTAQSAVDNDIFGENPCWGSFASDAILNTATVAVPALGPSAGLARGEQIAVNALYAATGAGMTQANSALGGCP